MAQIDNRYAGRIGARTDVGVDEGLRAYMLRVYNYMAGGIALTGLVAYVIFNYSVTTTGARSNVGGRCRPASGHVLTPFGQAIFVSPLKWVRDAGAARVRILPVLPHL